MKKLLQPVKKTDLLSHPIFIGETAVVTVSCCDWEKITFLYLYCITLLFKFKDIYPDDRLFFVIILTNIKIK